MIEQLIKDIESIEAGNKTALDTLKKHSNQVKDINDLYAHLKTLALKESEIYSKQELVQFGYEKRNGGVSGYDYSHCTRWGELEKEKKELEKIMQQGFKTGNSTFIEETGEIIEPAKPKGYKKDTLIVKL